MQNAAGTLLAAVLILAVTVTVCPAKIPDTKTEPHHPTALELLDKYGETQDKLYQSFIIKFEVSIKSSSSKPGEAGIVRHMKEAEEFRFDGKTERFSKRTFLWGNVASPFENYPKDDPLYQSYMWDGKDLFQYARNPFNPVSNLGIVHLTKNKDRDAKIKRLYSNAGSAGLRGSILGSIERIDSELRKAHTISVRDRTEKVGDSECYVIDAMTKIGKFTVWIDPKHGYNIARFNHEINGRRGDLVYGRPLHRDDIIYGSLKNVRFEKINGLWVPMEADGKYYRDMGKDYSKSETHLKRTEVKLDVDHNALGSFVPDDIKNGARVYVIGLKDEYKWQNGQVVDEKGREVDVDKLIKAESEKVKKPKPKRK